VAGLPGLPDHPGLLPTGVAGLDEALGGGLPRQALIEIHGAASRDAGAVAGFALALVSLLFRDRAEASILWIGTTEVFRESGFPYAPGFHALFGIDPARLLVSEAGKLEEALWIAEEASRLRSLGAVLLETRGASAKLDLTATRRLHRRARDAGRPVVLLRQGVPAEPTAAPVRLLVSPAPAACRRTLDGPLESSIGPPAFTVAIGKSRTARPGTFVLEWNEDERGFEERRHAASEDHGAVVSGASGAKDHAAAMGEVVPFEPVDPPARRQRPREERPADRRSG